MQAMISQTLDWMYQNNRQKILKTKLRKLISSPSDSLLNEEEWKRGLTETVWRSLIQHGKAAHTDEIRRRVYFGGVEHKIRKEVWPYLLEHFRFGSSLEEREKVDFTTRQFYAMIKLEWKTIEEACLRNKKEPMNITQRDYSKKYRVRKSGFSKMDLYITSDGAVDSDHVDGSFLSVYENALRSVENDGEIDTDIRDLKRSNRHSGDYRNYVSTVEDPNIIRSTLTPSRIPDTACISSTFSHKKVYSVKTLDSFTDNLQIIGHDVERCDRHLSYFDDNSNLEKLRNVITTYVWKNLDIGYKQGMCDIAAPLLVVFDDEALTYACFCRLMSRIAANFTNSDTLKKHYRNLRHLIELVDPEIFSLMEKDEDYTSFCYRWFLLDFKRELNYEEIFAVWEVIWSARFVSSNNFDLFIALSLVQTYRNTILEKGMDGMDVLMFFNDKSEKHDVRAVLNKSRELISHLHTLLK